VEVADTKVVAAAAEEQVDMLEEHATNADNPDTSPEIAQATLAAAAVVVVVDLEPAAAPAAALPAVCQDTLAAIARKPHQEVVVMAVEVVARATTVANQVTLPVTALTNRELKADTKLVRLRGIRVERSGNVFGS
jgi:non-ribosomal peptide synthetase component F